MNRSEHQMSNSATITAESYVHLALAIGQHKPGYVDAYYGPTEWQDQAAKRGLRPLAELEQECKELGVAIAIDPKLNEQRCDYLTKEFHSMQSTLSILQGQTPSLIAEAEALYDITPEWTEEVVFEECHQIIDEILPPGNSLRERLAVSKEKARILVELDSPLFEEIVSELQSQTRARFWMPPNESLEVKLVNNQSWSAYNYYVGEFHSMIAINIDLPMDVVRLLHLIAHEAYPGHHTELSTKEAHLTLDKGWIEHSITLLNSPSCVVAEGIATRALEILIPKIELLNWCNDELFPRAGLQHLDSQRELAMEITHKRLTGVRENAAFLLHEKQTSEKEILAYIQRYGLMTEREAKQTLRFLQSTRSYIFTYRHGGELLDALFARHPYPDYWFARLLSEPVTPSQIRAWIGSEEQ